MRSILHTKLPHFLRLSSLAGNGLPERMRTTAFAFLGLTAALGLALVAIFAQLNFPLLSPVPLPSEAPAGHVAPGVALGDGPDPPVAALERGIPAPAAGAPATRRGTERSAPERGGDAGVGGTAPVPVPSRDDAAAAAPENPASPPPSTETSPAAEPAPPATAQPEAEPAEPTPVKSNGANPKPSKAAAKADAKAKAAKAEAKAAAKAEKTEAKAAAKAEKAEAKAAAKAEKAASNPPKAEPAPASPPSAPAAPEAAPGNGKGKALGHRK